MAVFINVGLGLFFDEAFLVNLSPPDQHRMSLLLRRPRGTVRELSVSRAWLKDVEFIVECFSVEISL